VRKNKLFFLSILGALCIGAADAADVVQRTGMPAATTATAGRARPAPVAATPRIAAAPVAPVVAEVVTAEVVEELAPPVETRTAQFDTVLQESGGSVASEDSNLRDLIAAQRSADVNTAKITAANIAPPSGGANVCNDGLRACMKQKCGEKFEKCAGDGDTIWGDKMDSCRRTTKCTGREFDLLVPEIKADRDMEQNIGLFDEVLQCGERYNECIIAQCGPMFDGCIKKADGDRAIANCKKIADECRVADSGMPGRVMDVFGRQRQDAEIRVQKDYERLFELRKNMEAQCPKIGGMFDSRSFECVFTVEIRNRQLSENALATKKLHPGARYICSPEWFGIDATTFMEEAQRMTRAQRGSSSAFMGGMLGAGAGTALNAGMTGAMFNQGKTNTQLKKEDALDAECEAQGMVRKGNKCSSDEKDIKEAAANKAKNAEIEQKKQERQDNRDQKKEERQEKRDERKEQRQNNNSSRGGAETKTNNSTGGFVGPPPPPLPLTETPSPLLKPGEGQDSNPTMPTILGMEYKPGVGYQAEQKNSDCAPPMICD